jgi:hypothetical protein
MDTEIRNGFGKKLCADCDSVVKKRLLSVGCPLLLLRGQLTECHSCPAEGWHSVKGVYREKLGLGRRLMGSTTEDTEEHRVPIPSLGLITVFLRRGRPDVNHGIHRIHGRRRGFEAGAKMGGLVFGRGMAGGPEF